MEGMQHHVYRPTASLTPYVREFLVIRSRMPRAQVLLPEPGATIAFWLSGSATVDGQTIPPAVISGLQSQQRTANHTADTIMVVARFTPTGATAFLNDRSDLLYRQTIPLDLVLGAREVDLALEQLSEAQSLAEQIRTLERILIRRIQNGIEVSKIRAAVGLIARSGGRMRIPVVAKSVAMSERALERAFRSVVGASPKHLARLVRLQQACDLWDAGKSCTEIAHSAGFTDQSHFVHDFKQLSGHAPSIFLRRTSPRNLPVFYK
jgi:transcriptional regulator GlxA family with amidase domain